MNDTALQKVTAARALLAEAATAAQAKRVADIAKAAEVFALKQGSKEAAEYAHQVHADALRLEGEFLAIQEKAKGTAGRITGPGRGKKNGSSTVEPPFSDAPTLAQQGISKRESVAAQAVAEVAKEQPKLFEEFRTGKVPLKKVVQARKQKTQKAEAVKLPPKSGFVTSLSDFGNQKFACIYADPPWAYSNQATRASTDNHYSTMTVEQICALPIKDLAAPQAHLHLWTTNAFLFECPKIFEAWGFEFKSSFVWVKPQIGMGNYWRNSHEFLLLGVRGFLTAQARDLISWVECKRGEHSAKPDQVRGFVERLSPGPRLELFGRRPVDGWSVFGNEILDML